ncbi:MAG: hypothetical protein QOF65_1623 [Thermoleophilaceae bacterium]|jgi:hypothetical protein|nr:hypothetical protein [Thermoleophilaceae bacterium]MEA2437067.1 hypothetical protein [Thermoleophilaceae bacterium]
MPDFPDDQIVDPKPADDIAAEWQAPQLTVLGDAATMTANSTLSAFDGGLGSS